MHRRPSPGEAFGYKDFYRTIYDTHDARQLATHGDQDKEKACFAKFCGEKALVQFLGRRFAGATGEGTGN